MPERASSPLLRTPRTKFWRRRFFEATLLLVVVAFGVFYFTSLNASLNRLDVTLWNHTEGAITHVSFSEPSPFTPYDRIANDERIQLSVPLTDALVISFRGPDHRARTRDFAFQNVRGLSHRLEITLEKKVFDPSQVSTTSSTWPIGYKVKYRQPYNFKDPMTPYPPALPDIPNLESPQCP